MAEEAVRLDPSTTSEEALRAATLRDWRLRLIELPPSEFVGGAWSPDTPVVVAYTADHVTVIDVDSGQVLGPVEVDSLISLNRFVVGPGGRTAVYVDTRGELRLLDLAGGTSTVIAQEGRVIALSLAADGRLAWGVDDGSVSIGLYPETAGVLVADVSGAIPSFARAIDVVGETVAVVGDDGWARTLRIDGDALIEESAVMISERAHPDGLGGYLAGVTICGDTVSGSFRGPALLGVRFRWNPEAGTPVETVEASLETRPLCSGGGVLHASAVRGNIEDFAGQVSVLRPAQVVRNLGVFDPAHERAAFLSPTPGMLLVVDSDTAITRRELGAMHSLVVLRDRTLVVDDKLEVVDLMTGEQLGRLGEAAPVGQLVAVSGCDALIPAPDGVYHLSCTDAPKRVADATGLQAVRAASDGGGFVLARGASVELLARDGTLERRVEMDWLGQDVIAGADLSPDGGMVVIVTVLGRLYELPVTGVDAIPAPYATVPAGNDDAVAYLPDASGIVVLSADARLARFVDGEVVAARQLDFHADGLFVDGNTVLAASLLDGTAVLNAGTLAPIERFESGFFVQVPTDGKPALGLSFASEVGRGTVGLLVSAPPAD
jgi:hypothetical protein